MVGYSPLNVHPALSPRRSSSAFLMIGEKIFLHRQNDPKRQPIATWARQEFGEGSEAACCASVRAPGLPPALPCREIAFWRFPILASGNPGAVQSCDRGWTSDASLDLVEAGDPPQRLIGNGGVATLGIVKEATPHMRPAEGRVFLIRLYGPAPRYAYRQHSRRIGQCR